MMFLGNYIKAIEFLVEYGDLICSFLLSGMAVVAVLWHLANSRRESLAVFTGEDGSKMRVRKMDNTVGFKGSGADLEFPRPSGRRAGAVQGFLLYSMSASSWSFITKASGKTQPVQDGAVASIFGFEAGLDSYVGDKPGKSRLGASFALIVIMALMSAAFQFYIAMYASYHCPKSYEASPLTFFTLCVAEFLVLILMDLSRVGPENVLALMLSYLGYVLFPSNRTFVGALLGWGAYLLLPRLIKWLLPKMGKTLYRYL
jgi:hypothetical protein